MSYDFDKVAKLLAIYVSINKDGISQLMPVAGAAMKELKQMILDEDNAATFTNPNPSVDESTTDHDGDGLVTTNDQNIEDGVDVDADEDEVDGSTQPVTKEPIATTQRFTPPQRKI